MNDVDAQILVRAGSTRPPLQVTLTDEDGNPVDLTGTTVMVTVVDGMTGDQLWTQPAILKDDPTTGEVTYNWRPEDVATAGNYGLYFHVTWTDTQDTQDFPTSGPLSFTIADPAVDAAQLLVPASAIKRRIGITDEDWTSDLQQVVEDIITDVQADVEGYLYKPVVPTRFTEMCVPDPQTRCGWSVAWEPVIKILSISATPDPWTGACEVQYVAGIQDPIAIRAISRYITSAASEEFRANPVYGKAYRAVRSLSAGGRSITYDEPSSNMRRSSAVLPAYPQPGAPPSIETLARWRRRLVFSRPRWIGAGAVDTGDAYGWITGWYSPETGEDALFVGDARTGEVFLS